MNVRIQHDTVYRYQAPISSLASELHLRPLNNWQQMLENFRLVTEPATRIYDYIDRFGNTVHHFTIPRFLQTVRVSAISVVSTVDQPFIYRAPTGFLRYESLHQTRRTDMDDLIQRWILAHDQPDFPLRERVQWINQALHDNFGYEAGVSSVRDTARDFVRLGRGVCQDFAHLALSVFRYLGIPALYVSGYVIPQDVSPTASHAWVVAYCHDQPSSRDWVGLDPVAGKMTDERYVWIALGRDYDDVTPVRGVYWGNSEEELEVQIHAEE